MSATERFASTVTLERWPYCPACGRPLTPDGIQFVNAYAFCAACVDGLRAPVQIALEVLRQPEMMRFTINARGLFFFANHDKSTTGLEAVRLLQRLAGKSCMIDAATRTPTIVDAVQQHRGRPAHTPRPDAAQPSTP